MEPSKHSSMDLLLQFVEESGELTHALSKLIRKERGNSPTPATRDECLQHLAEEIADVSVVLEVLLEHYAEIDPEEVERIRQAKKARWRQRLSQ